MSGTVVLALSAIAHHLSEVIIFRPVEPVDTKRAVVLLDAASFDRASMGLIAELEMTQYVLDENRINAIGEFTYAGVVYRRTVFERGQG